MIVNEVWYDNRLSHKEKIVHAYMRGQYVYYRAQNNKFTESTKRICLHTDVNRTTLFKVLNKLEACGYLTRLSEFGVTSEYILTDSTVKEDIKLARKSMGIKDTRPPRSDADIYPQFNPKEEEGIPF